MIFKIQKNQNDETSIPIFPIESHKFLFFFIYIFVIHPTQQTFIYYFLFNKYYT